MVVVYVTRRSQLYDVERIAFRDPGDVADDRRDELLRVSSHIFRAGPSFSVMIMSLLTTAGIAYRNALEGKAPGQTNSFVFTSLGAAVLATIDVKLDQAQGVHCVDHSL